MCYMKSCLTIYHTFWNISSDMISGGKQDSEDGRLPDAEPAGPSLAGLYAALEDYPLTYFQDPAIMHCPAQAFHSRLAVRGEVFPDDWRTAKA